MKVYYCLPTYKSFDLAYESILAALRSSMPPDEILVADNTIDSSGIAYLQPLTSKFANISLIPMKRNNLSFAWNTFFNLVQESDAYVINANDDIQVDTYTIEKLVTAAIEKPNEIMFAGDGSSGNAFSLFLLTQRGYNLIGKFDEKFDPAYFEDNDYNRRMQLKGFKINFVNGATYGHVGSSTLKRYTQPEMEMHHNAFRACHAYFLRKWGGKPHEEIYETPFNE
jgi:GT2 family glycosyltransferase